MYLELGYLLFWKGCAWLLHATATSATFAKYIYLKKHKIMPIISQNS